MKVNLKSNKGVIKKINLNFSFLYFLFGPLYLLSKKYIFRFLLVAFLYLPFVWGRFLNSIYLFISDFISLPAIFEEISLLPLEEPLYSYILIGIIHLVISLLIPRLVIKKALKKEDFHPEKEIDTQKLIKYRLTNIGTESYKEVFYPEEGVGGKIKISEEKHVRKELNNLASLLKSGMIDKDSYNQKRAKLIMSSKKK